MILFEFCPFTFSRLATKPIKIDKNNILNKLIVFLYIIIFMVGIYLFFFLNLYVVSINYFVFYSILDFFADQ